MRSKSCLIAFIIIFVLILSFICYSRYYIPWKYLSDYRELVASKADIKQIKAVLGEPQDIINSEKKYKEWDKDFPIEIGKGYKKDEKLFVYYEDPWGDGEGYMVYLMLDKNNKANGYKLCSHQVSDNCR
jgi:hypothetical protein